MQFRNKLVPFFIVLTATVLFLLLPSIGRCQGIRITDADVNLENLQVSRSDGKDGVVIDLPGKVEPAARVELSKKGIGARGVNRARSAESLGYSTSDRGVRLSSYRTADNSVLVEAVYRECRRYNIDPELVFSVIWQESRGKLHAVSPVGARGPMQLMPATAARFGVRNPHDPDQAVRGGVAYLVWLLDRYRGDVSLALASYNAGEGAVDAYLTGRRITLKSGRVINPRGIKTGGIPPYTETQNYVRNIAGRYRSVRNGRIGKGSSQ